jgi:hypothetical protein
MRKKTVFRTVQITLAVLAVAAIFQELRQPPEKRKWHGRILYIPYDFRKPTLERVKETYWNPYEKRVIVPMVFGMGWTINLYSFFENLGFIHWPGQSEENFLMPNKRMKQILMSQKSMMR